MEFTLVSEVSILIVVDIWWYVEASARSQGTLFRCPALMKWDWCGIIDEIVGVLRGCTEQLYSLFGFMHLVSYLRLNLSAHLGLLDN